ncbi:MAG: D-alanyl-D-alanine carboxypeptidase [Pseudomonadota bacterium]
MWFNLHSERLGSGLNYKPIHSPYGRLISVNQHRMLTDSWIHRFCQHILIKILTIQDIILKSTTHSSARTRIINSFFAVILSLFFGASAWAASSSYYVRSLTNKHSSSLYVKDASGRSYHSYNIDAPMVPASTMKIVTAYLALKRWGKYHQFYTDNMLDRNGVLWVKSYGDPFMVTEELSLMANGVASRLKARGIRSLKGIRIDDSFFHEYNSQLETPRSLNPYDAPLGATSVNFNSIAFRNSYGDVYSTDEMTPLTSVSYEISELKGNGRHRVSLRNGEQAQRHYSELFKIKLQERGIHIGAQQSFQQPRNLPVLYRHYNTRSLEDVVINMLKYSNNFIANQLFLAMAVDSANIANQSASLERSQRYARHILSRDFGWRHYFMADGAGLSRENQMSARQMADLLDKFKPYADLLPCIHYDQVCAKTGTLSNVHTYAGYLLESTELHPFVIFAQQRMPYNFRKKMASALYDDLFGSYNY